MTDWKRKIAAFLHDPPHKPLDFSRAHEEDAGQILKAALPGSDIDWLRELTRTVKEADHYAAAADRFCFPRGAAAAHFTGKPGATFKHPLGKAEFQIESLPNPGQALEWLQNAFGGIKVDQTADEQEQWRQHFFLYWRRFLEQTVLQGGRARDMVYYPADTRIPDHTIWNHMSVASALEGCRVNGDIRPSFLIFQLGPVQDFIAAARSTRDLWSGSYLLAYLTANAIKAVSDKTGPDSIIFPALRGQGVFDILHQHEIYSSIEYKSTDKNGGYDTLWRRMYEEKDDAALQRLLSPTLPNRFVALVPETEAQNLGEAAEAAVIRALKTISEACFKQFTALAGKAGAATGLIEGMGTRWKSQVEMFPQLTWVATPWRHDIDAAIADFAQMPINQSGNQWTPFKITETYRRIAKTINQYDDNAGFLWMLNYHRAEYALAARRNTREFSQFVTDPHQPGAPKDALTGKEEIIGDENLWGKLGSLDDSPFKSNEGPYGAISIIKRLWWREEAKFFPEKLSIDSTKLKRALSVESVGEIAGGNKAGGETDDDGEYKPRNPYVAIIALDGDEMGKWVSGAKTPKLLKQVASTAKEFLKKQNIPEDLPRALTPSYHMQFSEALTNFASYLTGTIVSCYSGQLVYAGGDDVLAIVPADNALDCARTLRAAFRGSAEDLPTHQREFNFGITQKGFVLADGKYPLIMPGPAAEVSVGIAFAHYQHPLQAVVREAQHAEKRAKADAKNTEGYNRAAFTVSLLKRGGETVHWGAKWDWNALDLYDSYCEFRNNFTARKTSGPDAISGRFPYALANLLRPYRLAEKEELHQDFNARAIIAEELETVFERQGGANLRPKCSAYLKHLEDTGKLQDFANLFLTAAFIERERGE